MKNVIAVLIVITAIALVWQSVNDDTSSRSSSTTSSAVAEPKFNVDTSSAMQTKRRDLIQKFKDAGVIYQVNNAGLYVDNAWSAIKYDQKEAVASMVFAYQYAQDPSDTYLTIYSGRTGKQIGGYGRYGLSMD